MHLRILDTHCESAHFFVGPLYTGFKTRGRTAPVFFQEEIRWTEVPQPGEPLFQGDPGPLSAHVVRGIVNPIPVFFRPQNRLWGVSHRLEGIHRPVA